MTFAEIESIQIYVMRICADLEILSPVGGGGAEENFCFPGPFSIT